MCREKEGKEEKTEAEMDGQHQARHDRDKTQHGTSVNCNVMNGSTYRYESNMYTYYRVADAFIRHARMCACTAHTHTLIVINISAGNAPTFTRDGF